jgi:hypothetical protein
MESPPPPPGRGTVYDATRPAALDAGWDAEELYEAFAHIGANLFSNPGHRVLAPALRSGRAFTGAISLRRAENEGVRFLVSSAEVGTP